MNRICWAGDSTVKENKVVSFPQTGIGQEFHRFLRKGIEICNFAENGRSTKSFIDEYRLAEIYHILEEGDFFFIQFGHNDQKSEDPNRYTNPETEFPENLTKFIHVARNKGAMPVLITPVERRMFGENGELMPSAHDAYSEAILALGVREGVPVIDLHKKSREFLANVGDEPSKEYFVHVPSGKYPKFPDGMQDNTHLRPEGAFVFGQMIAEGLKELGSPYSDLLYSE